MTTQDVPITPVTVPHRSTNDLAQDRTNMAASRTLLAADRTLMSWIRTALSMLSFGFTIYKVLQGFQDAGVQLRHPTSPQRAGLFLTTLGIAAMAMGTIQYFATVKDLRKYGPASAFRPVLIMAILMCCAGLALFYGIISRVF